jgi:hypothetical protein
MDEVMLAPLGEMVDCVQQVDVEIGGQEQDELKAKLERTFVAPPAGSLAETSRCLDLERPSARSKALREQVRQVPLVVSTRAGRGRSLRRVSRRIERSAHHRAVSAPLVTEAAMKHQAHQREQQETDAAGSSASMRASQLDTDLAFLSKLRTHLEKGRRRRRRTT